VQLDPTTHLWMHDQELKRTMRANALAREAKEAQARREGYPVRPFRVNPIRAGLNSLREAIRPAGTGAA
jgi:hypothetical protein